MLRDAPDDPMPRSSDQTYYLPPCQVCHEVGHLKLRLKFARFCCCSWLCGPWRNSFDWSFWTSSSMTISIELSCFPMFVPKPFRTCHLQVNDRPWIRLLHPQMPPLVFPLGSRKVSYGQSSCWPWDPGMSLQSTVLTVLCFAQLWITKVTSPRPPNAGWLSPCDAMAFVARATDDTPKWWQCRCQNCQDVSLWKVGPGRKQ